MPFISLWIVLAITLYIAWRSPRTNATLIPVAAATLGMLQLELKTSEISPIDIRLVTPEFPILATIEGDISSEPEIDNDSERPSTRFLLRIRSITTPDGSRNAMGHAYVTLSFPAAHECSLGSEISVAGVLRIPSARAYQNGFNFREYLRLKGVYRSMYCNRPGDLKILAPKSHPRSWSALANETLSQNLGRGIPKDHRLDLLRAMTLGRRDALTDELRTPFQQTGVLHVFAISGLHIGIVAALTRGILRRLGFGLVPATAVALPILWAYIGIVGAPPSALRAGVMISVILLGALIRRPGSWLNSLLLAALLILLADPRQLFQIGFQLSFSVALALCLTVEFARDLARRVLRIDPLLPEEFVPRWRRILGRIAQAIAQTLIVSLVAWSVSAPLIAYSFQLVTPIAPFANTVLVPLAGPTLFCAMISFSIGSLVPAIARIANYAAWSLIGMMDAGARQFATLPWNSQNAHPPNLIAMGVFYSALLMIAIALQQRPSGAKRWLFGASSLLASVAISFFIPKDSLRLTGIPFSHGHAIHIHDLHSGSHDLIEAGSETTAVQTLQPYLEAQGVNRISNLFLTHGDTHLVGGASHIVNQFHVQRFWVSGAKFRSSAFQSFAQSIQSQSPNAWRPLFAGDDAHIWRVLHPEPTPDPWLSKADDLALVLYLERFGARILTLSESSREGQDALLNRYPNLEADFLFVGLPDSGDPISPLAIQQIDPAVIVLLNSSYPHAKRGDPRFLASLERNGRIAFQTAESGAIRLTLTPKRWTLSSPTETLWTQKRLSRNRKSPISQ